MSGLIGKKIGMTSLFDEQGKNIACTVIEAGPCVVTQVKTEDKDGYSAVQLGFGEAKEKRTSAPQKGHFKNSKTDPKSKLVEFKGYDEANLGDVLNVDVFEEGEWVSVTGTSKGKGWAGVVKRHGFRGVGDSTHGQHNRNRAPGSIGAASYPARVFKGMRMAGRMGGDTVTVENLQILKKYSDKNLLVVKGAIPGSKGSYVIIRK